MIKEEFLKLVAEARARQDSILEKKGKEYARSPDVLANFKRTAESYGITTKQAWGSHFDKHCDAVRHFAKTSGVSSDEGIEGRIDDAINYLYFLLAIVKEKPELATWATVAPMVAGEKIEFLDLLEVREDGKLYRAITPEAVNNPYGKSIDWSKTVYCVPEWKCRVCGYEFAAWVQLPCPKCSDKNPAPVPVKEHPYMK